MCDEVSIQFDLGFNAKKQNRRIKVMGPVISYILEKGTDYFMSLGLDKVVDKLTPNPIENAYDRALKKWCRNEEVRNRYAVFKYSHFEDFRQYLENGPEICCEEIRSLCVLLEEELKKDFKTYSFIAVVRLKSIQESQKTICNAIETIQSNNELHEVESLRRHEELICWLQKIDDSIMNQRKLEPTKASLCEPVVDYIERKCSYVFDEKNYLDKYLHPEKYPEFRLIDFVLGVANKDYNRCFLLCGDAQSGKTTELVHLFYELDASGLFRLFYQEIKGWEFSIPDLSEAEQRETIVIIDALDERFNDEDRNSLFHRINTFAKRHPFLKMVVSCRSNFKEINYLDDFKQLQLLDLNWEESQQIINSKSDKPDQLISEIDEKKLFELTRTPLFLLTLIEYYQLKKHIPDNKSELYDYIINRQLEKEEEKGVGSHSCMVDAGRIALESLAISLQLMNRNSISEYMLLKLFDDKTQWTRIQRSRLIEKNKDGYSFSHNSFKEYLLSLFLKRLNSIKEIQEFCCYNGEKVIKQTWYNVFVLYLSQLSNKDKLFSELIEWLEQDNEEMLLYVEPQLIDEDKCCDIFIGILEECKRKGIIYGVRNDGLLKALMSFGFGRKSINYIVGELEKVVVYDTHVSNLLRCVQYLYWPSFVTEDSLNASKLTTLVFKIFKRFCGDRNAWAIWEPFENLYFYNRDTCEILLSNVRDSEHPDILNSFIRFMYNAGLSNDYIDFIIEKSEYVHNYDDNGVTCAVYPIWINESFKRVNSKEGVIKVLGFLERGINNRKTRSEFVVEHKGVIDAVVVQAEKLIPEEELTNMLIRIFEEGIDPITSYGEIYDFNRPIVSYLEKRDLSEQLFFYYAEKVVEFIRHEGLLSHKYSQCAACFATTERFDTFASNYFNTEKGFISVRCLHSYLLDKKIIDYVEVINVYFPDFVCYLEDRVENNKRSNLKCLFDYESFKGEVLLLLNEHPENRKELSKRLYNYDGIEDQLNKHVYSFFNEFLKGQEYDFDRIKEFIENKDFYKWFLLHETIGFMLSNSDELSVQQRQEVCQIAKDFIERFVNEDDIIDRGYVYYPIELMMKGYIKGIDVSCLNKLLHYSSDFVIDNVTLFQYIIEQPGVKTQTVMDFILSKINSREKINDFTLNRWAGFIICNKIENAYPLVVEWAINDQWGEIIPMLVEEPTARKLIINKTVLNRFSVKNKLDVFWNLVIKTKNEHDAFVKGELESVFDEIEDENEKISALRMLLMLGSIAGLQYITKRLEYYKKDRMLPNYGCEEALPMLFDSLDYLLEKRKEVESMRLHESKMSVISSIGKIASLSHESFSSIENRIEELVLADKDKYSELNYYVSQWKESLYSSNSKEWTIKEVKDVLKAYEIAS